MGSYLDKKSVQNGNIDFDQADRLSQDFNLSIASIEELKRKYLMYRVKSGSRSGINIHNYVVLYKEYVNQNANETEIYKSFNAFDSRRDGCLNFVQLLTAISWHTGITRPNYTQMNEIASNELYAYNPQQQQELLY